MMWNWEKRWESGREMDDARGIEDGDAQNRSQLADLRASNNYSVLSLLTGKENAACRA